MFKKKEEPAQTWRDGVFLRTVSSSWEADILESKLRGEGIPCQRKYAGAGNFLEIVMGVNTTCPIDLYVPAAALEDAQNTLLAPDGLPEDPEDDPTDER
jgi:hypothetical protein